MFKLSDDPFLPTSAESVADQAMLTLQRSSTSAEAVAIAISMEDTIQEMQSRSELTDVQARRLYLIFEMALETRLRSFGVDCTPRRFP